SFAVGNTFLRTDCSALGSVGQGVAIGDGKISARRLSHGRHGPGRAKVFPGVRQAAMQRFRVPLFLICTALCAACPRRDVAHPGAGEGGVVADPAGATLAAIAAEQLQAELQLSPTTATWLGDHRYDDRLDEVHDVVLRAEVARLRGAAE